ncbi:hypothetical protein BTR23_19630 [Alkalihalophilus pseudofirmus]|uniref:hypothetical protein n=1 Tax=Alkalihalobacterium alkalinitrilicum TaxID=427920 RepID=UPI00094C106B|nr:hypothetical protein [Alkalihalobacterium alkalinitrilicum]OLO27636.1 hypothetical protein BTR23_19630 [Alkalihalophilus pseudofirmus]
MEQINDGTGEEEPIDTPDNGEVVETPAVNSEVPDDDEEMVFIPEMKELECEVEGEMEKGVAHLTVSDLNYSHLQCLYLERKQLKEQNQDFGRC